MRRNNEGHSLQLYAKNKGFMLYLTCASAIAFILSLYFIITGHAFAFVDIGLDTYSQYYPFQVAHARQMHELRPMTWSFDAGLGSYIGSVSNLLIWIAALFPESWQLALRLPTYLIQLLLAGGFFFGYLRKLGVEQCISTAGALAYAFCGYALVNGQWDTVGFVIPQLAAYIFFVECYFRGGKGRYAVAAGFAVGCGGAFATYTFALFTVLYFLVRPLLVSKDDDARPYVSALLKYIGASAVGFMLTAPVQIPNLIYLLSNPRVSGDHSILSELLNQAWALNNFHTLASELCGLFGKSMLGTGSRYHGWLNWFEAPGFYISILLLVCIPQLLGPNASRREKCVCVSGLVLLLIYLLWPFMRYAVYGFGHRGFRLSTLWVSLGLLVMGILGLRRMYRTGSWRTGLILSTVTICILVLYLALRLPDRINFTHVAFVLAFTLAYGSLLWPTQQGKPRIHPSGIVIVLACELLLFAVPPVLHRVSVASNGDSPRGTYYDGTMAALAFIRARDEGADFYRIEKTYESVFLDDALVQGYSGTKSYFFHAASITRFVDKMGLPRRSPSTNYISSMVGRPMVLDLLGVRYLLSRNRKPAKMPGMIYVGHSGKISIYRNLRAHGVGYIYENVASEEKADSLAVAKRDALMLDHVIVKSPGKVRAQLTRMNGNDSEARVTSGASVSLRKITDTHLEATVMSLRAGIFLVSMPFDRGWAARVDGRPTALFRADYGLTALLLPSGSHNVSLRYSVPGRPLGEWLALVALVLLLAGYVIVGLRTRRIRRT